MSFLVIIPGTVLPMRPLVEVLREEHEARATEYAMRKLWREQQGIPSTPDIDWAEERRRLVALLSVVDGENPDGALVALGHQAGLMAMAPAPRDPGAWAKPDGLDGIQIAPRALSAARRNELRDAWRAAVSAGADSRPAADVLICESISAIDGVEVYGATDPVPIEMDVAAMGPLWEAGLAPYLLAASLFLTSLDPKKALRSGVLQLPT
jgi:hypothetical protein